MQITYQDKVALNENTGIADINKVKADDMNMIKNVVNANQEDVGDISNLKTKDITSIVNAVNEIEEGNYYSTEEKQIGKWIDNKPLYRKTINIGTITANTQKLGTTGINGLEIMIQSTTTCLYPNGAWHTISPENAFVYNKGANYSVIDGSNSTKCTMTILYTKTTDSPSN